MNVKIAALLSVLALFAGSTAGAQQMDPSIPPATEGPITLNNESYTGDHCARVTYGRAAVSRSCRFFYRFDPAAETDADNDHGVWWFQIRFRTRKGWCLMAADAKVTMPEGFVASAWTEKERRVRRKKRTISARLETTAGGNATAMASAERSFIVRKGRYASGWKTGTTVMRFRWSGKATRRTVAFAGGFDGSWPAMEAPQPYNLVAGPTYTRC